MVIVVGIYKITSPSGKVYIGQSWNIKHRFEQYKCDLGKKQKKLHASFMKYGFDSHSFEIIHELPQDIDQSELDNQEQAYMDAYRQAGFTLMNLREAGSRGKHTLESREKMKGRIWSEDAKRRIGEKNRINMTGKKLSEETKLKMSLSSRGRKMSAAGTSKRLETRKRNRNLGLHKSLAGSNHPLALITESDVIEIRKKYIPRKYTAQKLAEEFGVSRAAISSIVLRKNWAHVA